jgi:MFS transporter, ACDE family, multidrug resistance protein
LTAPQNDSVSPQPTASTSGKLSIDTNLLVIFTVTLMAILGVASIAPAFPKVVSELGISSQAVGLLITSFTLPGVILAPFIGVLADRIGRRRILIPSLSVFGIAGGMCGFTTDFDTILILRLIQGIGGASLGVLSVTIIGDLYSGPKRAAAMGYNASVLSIGTGVYPVIGGALATMAWHYPFLLAFLALPVGILVALFLRNPEPSTHTDLRTYAAGVWSVIWNRRAIALMMASLCTFVILYGSFLTYFPLLLGTRFAASSATIGILMAAMSFTTAAVSSQLGRLRNIASEVTLLMVAFGIYAVSMALVPFVPMLWFFLIPTIIFGVGHGLSIPCQMTLQAGLAPPEQRGAFMSMMGMVLRLGQTVGPLAAGLAFTFGGMQATFYMGAITAVLAIAALALAFRKPATEYA